MGVTVREKTKGSGEWWVFINHHGRRQSKKIGARKTALIAAEGIRAQLARSDLGILEPKEDKVLFGRYAVAWVEGIVKQTKSNGTYRRYSGLLKQKINKKIGGMPLADITRGNIRDLLLEQGRAGASRSSLGLIICVISGVMQHALDDELITANPAVGLTAKLGINRDQKKEIEPLTADETEKVLQIIMTKWPELYPFFLTAFRTGMRLGELCGLQWGDIDLHRRQIHVRRTAKDQHVTDRTKTHTARKIDMTEQLRTTLLDLRKKDTATCLELGISQKWVFHQGGKLMPQATVRRRWNAVIKKAEFSHRRLHDIRHTFASQLLMNGAPIPYVSKQLGHSNSHVTMTVYAHYIPDDSKSIINTLDSPKNKPYKVTSQTQCD